MATPQQTPSGALHLNQLLTVLYAYRKSDFSVRMSNDLISPLNEMIRVVGAVTKGDLSQNVPMEIDGLKLQGQLLKSAQIVNTMVTQLGTFSTEFTRVAREVGTDGKLGGQVKVKCVSGRWKNFTNQGVSHAVF